MSGTHLDNIDGRLRSRPPGPGRLLLALNRGSELLDVRRDGPVLLHRTPEDAVLRRGLDATAEEVADELRRRGLDVAVVGHRLNRTKIDLLPDPLWRDPPKARLGEVEGDEPTGVECRGTTHHIDVDDRGWRTRAGSASGEGGTP